jgi:hypothetical protein
LVPGLEQKHLMFTQEVMRESISLPKKKKLKDERLFFRYEGTIQITPSTIDGSKVLAKGGFDGKPKLFLRDLLSS